MWMLLIISIAFLILIILGSIYFVVYFQHEEDKNMAYFPKIVVISGLTLACINVMTLSSDVLNRDTDAGVNFSIVLQVFLMISAIYVVILVPFTMFYYETAEEEDAKPIKAGITWTIASLVVFGLAVTIFYLTIGQVLIPVKRITTERINVNSNTPGNGESSSFTWEVTTSPVVYIIGLVSLIGWVLFAMFGGVGIAALPFDLIRGYIHRPKPISLAEYARYSAIINKRANEILSEGRKIDSMTSGRKKRKKYAKFRQNVYNLEQDFNKVEIAYKERGGSKIIQIFKLILGILSSIISLLWFLHIILYILPKKPLSSFLNGYLIALDDAFSFFGTITYMIFSFYLLLCTIKGTIKLGLRLLFIPIHPIKLGETLMSSLVFNTALILVTSVSVTQFCSQAFDEYIRLTAIQQLFSTQISNLKFFKYVFLVLTYILVSFIGLTTIYIFVKPKDKSDKEQLKGID